MASYRLRFGAYDLPRTFRPVDEPLSISTGATERLRAPGAVTNAAGRLQPRTLSITGEFSDSNSGSLDDYLATRDAVISACSDGKKDLWFGRDDRFYKAAQLVTAGVSFPEDGVLYGVYGVITLAFEVADYPEAFGVAAHAVSLGAAGSAFTAQGQSPALALPTWTITIGSGGSGPLTLRSLTTGEACTIQRPGGAPFSGGDVIVLNRDGATATLNGVAVAGLFDRRVPRIVCGQSNQIQLSAGGTATAASLGVSYSPRYR